MAGRGPSVPEWETGEKADRLHTGEVDPPRCTYDPDMWFQTRAKEVVKEAKAICHKCPLQEPCLREGLKYLRADVQMVPMGVWGGYDHEERIEMRRSIDRRLAKKAVAA